MTPNGWEEILRLVSRGGLPPLDKRVVRTIVYKDMEGNYRISVEEFNQDNPDEITKREDIHGVMSKDAYLAWMSNALFAHSYSSAVREDRKWMMGD